MGILITAAITQKSSKLKLRRHNAIRHTNHHRSRGVDLPPLPPGSQPVLSTRSARRDTTGSRRFRAVRWPQEQLYHHLERHRGGPVDDDEDEQEQEQEQEDWAWSLVRGDARIASLTRQAEEIRTRLELEMAAPNQTGPVIESGSTHLRPHMREIGTRAVLGHDGTQAYSTFPTPPRPRLGQPQHYQQEPAQSMVVTVNPRPLDTSMGHSRSENYTLRSM